MSHLVAAKELAKKLKRFVTDWNRLDFSSTLAPEGKNATARIYEFYVSLRALKDLSADWKLDLVSTTKKKTIRFPHGPAEKVNYPYLLAKDRRSSKPVFQVCLGTAIKNKSGTTYAPDFSVQSPSSPNEPGPADFVYGWDQKHTSSNCLNRDETLLVSAKLRFVRPLASLTVQPFPSGPWPNGCAVVTNADYSTLSDSDLTTLKVSEVAHCNKDLAAFKTRP